MDVYSKIVGKERRLYEKEEEREGKRRKTSIIRNKGKEIIKIREHKVNG